MPLGASRLNFLAKPAEAAAPEAQGYWLTDAIYDNKSFDVSTFTNPNDVRFGDNGTKMYVCGDASDEVRQYTLSVDYDVSSASYASKSVSAGTGAFPSPQGLFFKPDGTKMYVCDTEGVVEEFSLSTAWDVSTASGGTTKSFTAQVTIPRAICMSSDGSKLFIADQIGNEVYQYTMSTPYSITSATYDSKSFDTGFANYGISTNNDGTIITVNGTTNMKRFDLSTANDVTTASEAQSFSGFTTQDNMSGHDFSANGQIMIMCGYDSTDSIYQYNTVEDTTAFEEAYTLSNLTFAPQSYQIPKISYAGDDSSGQPVFFIGTKDTSGNFVCGLIKRLNNGTLSESSVTTLKSADERFAAQGVAGFDTSGNPVGVTVGTYRVAGVIKTDVYCNQIDLDALTLGSTYSSLDALGTSNAGFAYATYLGNGRFGAGMRLSGIRTALATVGTSTVSVGSASTETSHGDGVYQGIYGVTYQNDTDYRWMSANGNANQHGAAWFAGSTFQGFAYSNTLTAGSLVRTEPFEITYDKMVTVARSGTTAQALASDITWPASGSPSLTNGSIHNFSDQANWNGGWCGASNLSTSTLHILHSHSTNGWQIRPLTVSGTTISEGSAYTVTSSTTNWATGDNAVAACFANSTQGDIFCALIDDTTINNPQIYMKTL